ncbi:hypothetical protein BVY04_05355 [bacterium M21]|nr:hypothetical protein BVY04_05355 [bacterium M21]
MTSYQADEPKKSKMPWILGCLGVGCLLPIILFVLGSMGAGVYFMGFVNDAPTVVTEDPAPEAIAKVERKMKDYQSTLSTNAEPEVLDMTPDELNMLIAKQLQENLDLPRVKIREIDGDTVIADFSALIPDAKPERWINGTAKVKLTITEGVLDYELVDLSTPKRDIPEFFEEALTAEIDKKLRSQGITGQLTKIKSLTIKDGQIQIQLQPHSVQ